MPLYLTKRQSLWLGIGLLAAFFLGSTLLVSLGGSRKGRLKNSNLSLETIGGLSADAPNPETTGAPVTTTPAASNQGDGFVLNTFQRNLIKDGKIVWNIVGKRGVYSAGESEIEVEIPKLTLASKNPQEDGKETVVTADKAVMKVAGGDLSDATLSGNVVLVYDNDTTVRTAQAIYKKAADQLVIPGYLEIENTLMFTSGQRASGQVEVKEFTLEGGVKSVIKPRSR